MSTQNREEIILRDMVKELGKIRAELHTLNLLINKEKECTCLEQRKTVFKESDIGSYDI